MVKVVGVDGCAKGWVFVHLSEGEFTGATLHATFGDGLVAIPDASAIGVDIPIGYAPDPRQPRRADGEARAALGRRHSSVFPTPPREVLTARNYAEANARCQELTGKGISKQSYAIAPKVLEVEPLAAADRRIYEVHPEVSFLALAGAPLESSKKNWNGLLQRRALLAEAGIQLPDDLGEVGGVAAPDDIVDAAVAAWSAARVAAGAGQSYPTPPEHDINGRDVAIWY
ncbi:MAG TPA: DUF429 domain-containing protein [Dehalococcoidia bacterium]|nr:DUF429 domain-containing protein [Dehalococcoidia bacterium]